MTDGLKRILLVEDSPRDVQLTLAALEEYHLANEVMESFIVNLDAFSMDTNQPPQATIEVFNVETEDTAELLSQPQHTNDNE